MSFLSEYRDATFSMAGQKQMKLVGQWMKTSPIPFFAELRQYSPILHTPKFILVSRYPDVREVLGNEKIFSVRVYADRMDPVAGPFMLARDGTIFNERDKAVMKVMLRQDDLSKVRTIVGRLTESNLDTFKDSRGIELVNAVSRRVPLQLCGDYFGFPGPDVESLMRWSKATQMDMFRNPTQDPQIHEESVQAGREMREFLKHYIPQQRAAIAIDPSLDDIVSRLLKTQFPEVIGFDEERILANSMGLLIGAGETTSQAVIQVLDQWFQRPEIFASATRAARSGDDQQLGQYVWEALRFNPISPGIARFCEEDYTIAKGTDRETLIPKGTVVLAATQSAMFDEREVCKPDEFLIDRPSYHYLHFGYGHHLCLGYYVGLVMIPEILKRLLLRAGLCRASGSAGQIDYKGGPFPEEFWVQYS